MIAAYSGVLFTPQSKVLVQLLRRSICRRAAVQLVESCLAKQPDYPRPRQFHRPAEDIQIEKPSTRCVEALVGTTKRGPHLPFHKERVQFLCRKKPAIQRQLVRRANFEQTISVSGPVDFGEQIVFIEALQKCGSFDIGHAVRLAIGTLFVRQILSSRSAT